MIAALSAIVLAVFWLWLLREASRRRMVCAIEVTAHEASRLRVGDRVQLLPARRPLVVCGHDFRRDVLWLRD